MSSTEFNVDSLLDDINDVDISTPWGGSSHTSIRNAPLPPGSDKSLFNVRYERMLQTIVSLS